MKESELLRKATEWLNTRQFEEEMVALDEDIQEYDHCYALLWCVKSEQHLPWSHRTEFTGGGRLLISKDGLVVDMAGSAPDVDWIHHFNLKLFGLEDFWYLEIPYTKNHLSKLKAALKCSTADLLKMVDDNGKIIFTESKARNDNWTELKRLAQDLGTSGVECLFEVRTREKPNN